jgi:hypothetical protein
MTKLKISEETISQFGTTASNKHAKVNIEEAIGWSREDLLNKFPSKAAAIRFLVSQKFKDGDIARYLNISHQHARNTRLRELKR